MTIAPRRFTGDPSSYLATTAHLLDTIEPRLQALSHVDRDLLECPPASVDGPLAGMPIAIKEIIDVAGMPTTFGSEWFAARVPDSDAEAVARLRAAGALIIGMTTTTPFACGTTTRTDNPVAPGHTPGGSSAGSGAAVGAGFVPAALGSQSQASTLRPASYCGAWGFKPSHGRFPVDGMFGLAETLDDLGVIAASLDDLRAVFEALVNARVAAPRDDVSISTLRVCRLRLDDGDLPSSATIEALDQVIESIERVVPVVDDHADALAIDNDLVGSGLICFDLFASESAPALATQIAAGESDLRLREMVDHAAAMSDEDVQEALAARDRLRTQWAALSDHFDVIITLSTTNQAPRGHDSTGCRRMPATSSLLGVPALTAPWASVDGLPQGIQLLGFEGADEELLAAAELLHELINQSEVPDHQETS